MSDGMGRELAYLSSHATNRYFIPNWGVSNDILEEYEEVLCRNINPKVARIVLAYIQILPNVKFIDPHYSFGLIKADEDDNKFVDCAIASNAIFIVSEDKHFKELENISFPRVEVIGIDDFLKYLKK